jgi:hypothetical protein
MKTKIALLSACMGIGLLLTIPALAQTTDTTRDLKTEQQLAREKEQQDKQRMEGAQDLRKSTNSEARYAKRQQKEASQAAKEAKQASREASRIEKEASRAAKEAKQSAKMEAKAQRNRENADKQARKAAKAAEKID